MEPDGISFHRCKRTAPRTITKTSATTCFWEIIDRQVEIWSSIKNGKRKNKIMWDQMDFIIAKRTTRTTTMMIKACKTSAIPCNHHNYNKDF